MTFQTAEIVLPRYIRRNREIRIRELQFDVFDVVAESLPKQSSHVFKKKSPGAKFANSPHRFGKHIPSVLVATRFATHRERLAWRTSGDEVDLSKRGIIDLLYVFLNYIPGGPVEAQGGTGVPIPLYQRDRFKPGFFQSKRKTAGP